MQGKTVNLFVDNAGFYRANAIIYNGLKKTGAQRDVIAGHEFRTGFFSLLFRGQSCSWLVKATVAN
jgi:hypothetical protein